MQRAVPAVDTKRVATLPVPPLSRARPTVPIEIRLPARDGPDGLAPEVTMLGRSRAFERTRDRLLRLAPSHRPVLVRGETGTGKELAARLLHEGSPRRVGPFVAINCAAVPSDLAESELFGHARGAFTGAVRDHVGAFVRAGEGTLLLDEVGELPPVVQAKLLRVLELGQVAPLGSEREQPVRARVVAATHRDLEAMVACGRFREDLMHRLGVLCVRLPALRERVEDIPLLMEHFVRDAELELGRRISVTPAAVQAAREHPWPGNVRALRNAVIRAAILTDGPIGPRELLPGDDTGASDGEPAHGSAEAHDPAGRDAGEHRLERRADGAGEGEGEGEGEDGAAPAPPPRDGGKRPRATGKPAVPHAGRSAVVVGRASYDVMVHQMLEQVVAAEGSIRRAAEALEIPRSTLGARLRRHAGPPGQGRPRLDAAAAREEDTGS